MNPLLRYKSSRTLVLGGSGFIGSQLANKLSDIGSNVSIFYHHKVTIPNVTDTYYGDVNDPNIIETVVKNNQFDVIFHCAGYSNHFDSRYIQNCHGKSYQLSTENILNAIRKYSPKTVLVLLSSRLTYGKAHYLPVDENHPTVPTCLYGKDRLNATLVAVQYYRLYHIPSVIINISNAYGPHPMIKDRQYNIINYFIDLAKQKRALTIFGNGMQRRDYVYIDDVVNALLLAPINQIAYGQIYNIGYGKPIAFKDMVTGIAKKGNVKINYMPWPPEYLSAETGDYYCEISKAKKQLNWKPTISYEKGIDLCFG